MEIIDKSNYLYDNGIQRSKTMSINISIIKAALLICTLIICINGCTGFVEKVSGTQHIHRVQQTGKAAEAKVLKIWDTGIRVNYKPVVGFFLEVKPEGGNAYLATMQCIISIVDIPRIQPGLVLPARYDENDPSKVALLLCR